MLTLAHTHRWADGSSLRTTLCDGYYSRSMWVTQSSFFAGTTGSNLNPNTVVNRRTNAKPGEQHHTFLPTDYLTTMNWFHRKNNLLVGAEYAVEKSGRSTYRFGDHFDNAVRTHAATARHVRTDISCTPFLSDLAN